MLLRANIEMKTRLAFVIFLLFNTSNMQGYNIIFYFRTIVYWRSKDVDHILQGYKLNLQNAIGSKAPASILNFYFKYTFCRKVSVG